eukprot:jgi/Chrzof1/10037/Cz04g24280.t1
MGSVTPPTVTGFRGNLAHSPTFGSIEVLQDHVITWDACGNITHLGPAQDFECEREVDNMVSLPSHQLLLPGFVDTHVHAPQYPFTGTGTDLPLFDWLDTYTFPTEASFANVEYACQMYSLVVDRLLSMGTTTAAYFTTVHSDSCKALADIIHDKGQRALVGKVSMDQNAPDFYRETTDDGLAAAEDVLQHIQAG